MGDTLQFKDVLYNDAAIAVGVQVKDVITAPYDGYIVGVKAKGAGLEWGTIATSDGKPDQEVPCTDIAIDADPLENLTDGPGVMSGFVILNQPITKNTKVHWTPHGTGTAEANIIVRFSRSPIGPYTLNQHDVLDYSSAAQGDTIQECPTFMRTLKRGFIRGAALNDVTLQFGSAGGEKSQVFGRAIAENTDAEPFIFGTPFGIDTPDRIIFDSMNGATGNVHHYIQYE